MKAIKVGVVTSRFNEEITSKLEEGALNFLEELDIEILSVRVPGAVEIPLVAKALLNEGCDGVVALGCVIRGETSHYDYVCSSVERGITHLMLETGKPVGFGVLTTETEEQALDRVGGKHGHKGTEAAQVVIEMIGLLNAIKSEAGAEAAVAEAPKAAKLAAKPKATKPKAVKMPSKQVAAKTSKSSGKKRVTSGKRKS